MNVKNALKHVSDIITQADPEEIEMLICFAITTSLLLISIGWLFFKAPNVPAAETTPVALTAPSIG